MFRRKTRYLLLALSILFLACTGIAAADGQLKLPPALKVIEEEAFSGDLTLGEVVVPEGLERIEERAFANSTVGQINLPSFLEKIADDAFEGTNPGLVFITNSNSYAASWVEIFRNTKADEISGYDSLPVSHFDGKKYVIYIGGCSWHEAKEKCAELGGHLVTINSAEEQRFLTAYMNSTTNVKVSYWIGLTDEVKENDWSTWITGEKVTYSNWETNEPNDGAAGGQDYARISAGLHVDSGGYTSHSGKWDDVGDIYECGGFICEWENQTDESLSGSFAEEVMTLALGEKKIPAATITSKSGYIDQVWLTVEGWNQEASEKGLYAMAEGSGFHTGELSLNDMNELSIDTSKTPFSLPGTYTVSLWAGNGEGDKIKLDSLMVNVGWIRVIDAPNIPVYPGSYSSQTNEIVNLVGKILLIRNENNRYLIQYETKNGQTVSGWIDRDMIIDDYFIDDVVDASYAGARSGLQILVPFSHANGQWIPLSYVEPASVRITAFSPFLTLYGYSDLNTENDFMWKRLRVLRYDSIDEWQDGSQLFVFNETIDVTGSDRILSDENVKYLSSAYGLAIGKTDQKNDSPDIPINLDISVAWLEAQNEVYSQPKWEVSIYGINDKKFDVLEIRKLSLENAEIHATRVAYADEIDYQLKEYLLYAEKNGSGSEELHAIAASAPFFSDQTFQNIVPWKLLIEPSGNDYKMTVSLKSQWDIETFRPAAGTYRIVCTYTDDDGASKYALLDSFDYNGSGNFSRDFKLIADKKMPIRYNRTYDFVVLPVDPETSQIDFDQVLYGDYLYAYMFEDDDSYDETRYYAVLHQQMILGNNPLEDEKICDYLVRKMCASAMQKSDAESLVMKLKEAPALYRNLYLESFGDYSLGNLYTQKPLFGEPAAAYMQNGTITIMDYYYTKTNDGGAASNIVVFHESGHAIDYCGTITLHDDDQLYKYLVQDLKSTLTAELTSLGYSSSDISIILEFLISSKDRNTSPDSLISDVNASRKKNGISLMMKAEDYDALREDLYAFINDRYKEVGKVYLNALLITDVSAGLMNNKIYNNGSNTKIFLPGHPDKKYYWYDWFGGHTDKMCSEAWAEWFACQIASVPEVTRANRDFYPRAIAYMHGRVSEMLKHYISKHTKIDAARITINESTGGFTYSE